MIGTTAAIIIGASMAASATSKAVAAKKASNRQQEAAKQSNTMAQKVYQDRMNMTQPYRQAGAQSVGLLGSLMLPNGAPGGYRPGQPVMQASVPTAGMPPTGGVPRGVPQGGPGQAMNRGGMQPPPMNPWAQGQVPTNNPGQYGYPQQQPQMTQSMMSAGRYS